ncbi:hypothetical protein TrST_g3314 [Triparma strigata]|uniref:TauD/TfdA-like domain-containing protein n=1 Tax=Triparma strigata TaxID=1606541 RepID=A0A9W7BK76_9STRA|nr:hypothetical protein TrST_g3314 [Triparma strigata]
MKFTAFGLFFIPTVVSFSHTALTSRRLPASALSSTLERVAPSAGVVPQWEEQQGLTEEEFMRSDMSKPDLSESLLECPLTLWDAEGIDLDAARESAAKLPAACPLEIRATEEDNKKGEEYFLENKDMIRQKLLEHGSVWLRGFDLPKSVSGHRVMTESLDLLPCLDPLHSSGLRKFSSERDVLYEEVNKPSLRQHYIGLHCESTTKRTAAYASFVCFKKATEGGGRFLIADGAKILGDMEPNLLKKLYDRKVRISVSNLDVPPSTPQFLKEGFKNLVDAAVAPKFDMDLEMIYEADGKPGRLMAIEETESPINRHPVTGQPVWFCNAHNHLRYLRDRRPCGVPEVGMTDVFFGDLGHLSPSECDEIKRVSEKHITAVPMSPGDVLLVDNYRTLHGRDVFNGERYHAVGWFSWDDNEKWRGDELRQREKDGLNQFVNKYMDWLPKDF